MPRTPSWTMVYNSLCEPVGVWCHRHDFPIPVPFLWTMCTVRPSAAREEVPDARSGPSSISTAGATCHRHRKGCRAGLLGARGLDFTVHCAPQPGLAGLSLGFTYRDRQLKTLSPNVMTLPCLLDYADPPRTIALTTFAFAKPSATPPLTR